MSTSPNHFYASRPSSRQTSRPTSPPTNAELRTQAIAKLKRAASLPRTPAGRRPAQTTENDHSTPQPASVDQGGPSALTISTGNYDGDQEVLSASPVSATHNHVNIFPSISSTGMARSASASSSYHMPTPPPSRAFDGPNSASPYFSSAASPSGAGTPDWAAMQLAQSYLPSLSPVPNPSGAFLSHQIPGRSTPSPLPSLGELRSLQRSNSAAARAKAMTKLTGIETPVPDDAVISNGSPSLQRAGSVGAPRMLDLAILRTQAQITAVTPEEPTERHPRLQRSFTVSSSNMGEERRSAVGRRMVERLAKSKAARDKEEDEVRRLWEEKVGAKAANGGVSPAADADDQEEEGDSEDYSSIIPRVETHSPVDPGYFPPTTGAESSHLPVPERPPSRNTVRSADEAFEYESHLRRSLSDRTAREGIAKPSSKPLPPPPPPEVEHMNNHFDHVALVPPMPPFATPTRHAQHDSTSTQGTVQPSQGSTSPASTMSRDALGSMMFVLGSGPESRGHKIRDGSWPVGVEDVGSEWGTPAKHHEATFDETMTHSPLPHGEDRVPSPLSVDGGDSSPQATRPASDMSWEEVGGIADREVPSDPRYHGRKDSVSAKIKRTVETAMKKREQRRSSESSTSYSRRGSESSTSPSQTQPSRSISRAQTQRGYSIPSHPSLNSLSQTTSNQPESSANSILLQHQLNSDSSPGYLPRADLSDPRIHSSKLSPFPGIAQLEEKRKGNLEEPPRLVQQFSDSAIPGSQRANQPMGIDSIYALPLPSAEGSRRASDDSASKKGWLSKAFGASPRSSGSVSRKSSNPEIQPVERSHKIPSPSDSIDSDPFAAPSLPKPKPPRILSASPAVSVVHEASEEGSRFTRFTQHRQASPVIEQAEDLEISPKSLEVLNRMDDVLAMSPNDPRRPEMLDDPPRKLLLATQVLQVVNSHTVKDRYLFLFNDILVIAKPLITQGVHATLDMKFVVKSVVSLDKLQISGISNEEPPNPQRHPVVQNFIDRFAEEPVEAVQYLVERSNPKVDPVTLASLLFKTPELDKEQIGMLLAHNSTLLDAFIDRFHFHGIRLDAALRMFLLSIRLPTEATASETLLRGFAYRFFEANRSILGFEGETTADLVLAIMQLNDALYSTFGFAFENHAITLETFVQAFGNKGPRALVPRQLLEEIYVSIQNAQLRQALSTVEERSMGKEVVLSPVRFPTKLTFDVWSEPIIIRIPAKDDQFQIRLVGEGLEFEPQVLDFADGKEQSFRVKGRSLGVRSVMFERVGANAPLYASIGSARTFSVERSFMQHTFHLTFVSHLGLKRKYCYSVPDSSARDRWANLVQRQIKAMTKRNYTNGNSISETGRIRQAAENVALQVLRDALIPPEEKVEQSASPPTSHGIGSGVRGKTVPTRVNRTGSISVAYAGNSTDGFGRPDGEKERQAGLIGDAQTGKELVLLCRQNSLLPGLLQLLQAGIGVEEVKGASTNGGIRQRVGGRV